MADRRRFLASFKREVVGELLSESSTLGQLSRRYDISSGLILHWKSKEIVELHGGKIWVESREGEGSRFTFVIPRRLDSSAET